MNPEQLDTLIEEELAKVDDADRRTALEALIVRSPKQHRREWAYSDVETWLTCWTIVANPPSVSTTIVYCPEGFGPDYPWGILDSGHDEMGMDCDWHLSLDHAFLNSGSLWRGPMPPNYEVP